jgi:hypothetical protein
MLSFRVQSATSEKFVLAIVLLNAFLHGQGQERPMGSQPMAGPLCGQESSSVRLGPRHECSAKVVARPCSSQMRRPWVSRPGATKSAQRRLQAPDSNLHIAELEHSGPQLAGVVERKKPKTWLAVSKAAPRYPSHFCKLAWTARTAKCPLNNAFPSC